MRSPQSFTGSAKTFPHDTSPGNSKQGWRGGKMAEPTERLHAERR
jgi:hypothetical protein